MLSLAVRRVVGDSGVGSLLGATRDAPNCQTRTVQSVVEVVDRRAVAILHLLVRRVGKTVSRDDAEELQIGAREEEGEEDRGQDDLCNVNVEVVTFLVHGAEGVMNFEAEGVAVRY